MCYVINHKVGLNKRLIVINVAGDKEESTEEVKYSSIFIINGASHAFSSSSMSSAVANSDIAILSYISPLLSLLLLFTTPQVVFVNPKILERSKKEDIDNEG